MARMQEEAQQERLRESAELHEMRRLYQAQVSVIGSGRRERTREQEELQEEIQRQRDELRWLSENEQRQQRIGQETIRGVEFEAQRQGDCPKAA